MLINLPSAPRHDDAPPGADRSPGRVLVVDETGAEREDIALALRAEGFEVVESSCGQSAVEAARLMAPDVIVLDVCRPDPDGFELCRALKSAAPALLPVLHLSSVSTSSEDRARGLDAGADGYLAHPFDPNELRAAVGALVRLKRQDSERVAHSVVNAVLHDALDALADHVALLGTYGEVIAVNRAWVDFAAANAFAAGDTGLGANYCEVCEHALGFGASEAQAAAAGIRQILAGEAEGFELDYSCHSPTEERWYRMTVRPVVRPGPVAAIVAHTELTRERLAARAEAVAHEQADVEHRARTTEEALFRVLTEQSLEFVSIIDTDGRFKYVSPSVERTLGYSVEELLGTSPVDLVHPEDRSTMLATYFTLINGSPGTVAEMMVRLRRKDGAWRHFEGGGQNLLHEPSVRGITSNAHDVTERQAAARERERLVASLETERSRLAAIFLEASAFLAVLRGPEHVFERVNPAYLQLVGQRDVVGKPLLEALPEIRDQGFIELLDRVRTTGEPFIGKQIPIRLARVPDAPLETRYLDMVYQRLGDAAADYAIAAHGVDVTEHVVVAESLRRTEQRLRDQFAKLPVPTYLWEARGDDFVLLDWNEAAHGAAIHAISRHGAAAVGRTYRELFPGAEGISEELGRCLRENIVVRRSIEHEAGVPLGPRIFDLTIGPQQPDRVLVHAVDTTKRAELEGQLRQAQKMEAVGSLAGGVAHDFNNLLTVIGAHSAFLLESLDSSDPRHEDAEAIHKAGIRAAGLTRQLLAFSRKQLLKPTLLDLNAIIEETQKMLGRLLGEDIEILTLLASDLGRVVADATQIDQVLVNLAVNARDAMPDGGVLTIATRKVIMTADMPEARHLVPPGDYALLEVRDTGVGMDAAIQARLFEPFFTTKGPGKGTGLGLATVYGIVKQSAGYILVESAPGFGTTFQVYLPLASAEGAVNERRAAEGAAVRGVETVLLIEDEPTVREIAKRVLKRQGYVVLEAASGAEALAISTALPTAIHLVISDAVMPGMGGAETVRRLQEQRPGLKALIMSGYTDDEIVRRGIVSAAVPFVQKPFALADFARAVRDALDA